MFCNSQEWKAMLGLPDTDLLKIININIHSIVAEVAKNEECHTNMKAVQGSNTEQEKTEGEIAV